MGPYYTTNQIRGRIHFVAWVNPGRKRELLRAFLAIDWQAVQKEAAARGLVAAKKTLVRKADFDLQQADAQPTAACSPN
jgi:hypothetical protein